MIPLSLIALALGGAQAADLRAGPFTLTGEAALGARAWVWVGEAADTTRYDPVNTEGVGIAPLALEGEARTEAGLFALVRLEEGVVHAGAVEAAEARVGWAAPAGWGELWLGRGDLPVTRDRLREPEDRALGLSPVLSRATLPWHATGAAGSLCWPEKITLQGGLSYSAPSSDAPWAWGRLDLHPLGAPPDDERRSADGLVFGLGAGLAALRSPSLGDSRLLSADAELRWGTWLLSGGNTSTLARDTGGEETRRAAWNAQIGGGLDLRQTTLRATLRAERATGLEAGEDARWLGAGRLSLLRQDAAIEGFVEWLLSAEQGDGVEDGEDVVVLGRGVERANDALAIGLRLRTP